MGACLATMTLVQTSAMTPKETAARIVKLAHSISIAGQRVTFNRKASTGWIATGWEQGLPVHRKPVSDDFMIATLQRFSVESVLPTFS
jgi:hypothetical protein